MVTAIRKVTEGDLRGVSVYRGGSHGMKQKQRVVGLKEGKRKGLRRLLKKVELPGEEFVLQVKKVHLSE